MNEQLLQFLEDTFATSELNRLPEKYGGGRIFSSPLIGVASGNDPIFLEFKELVGPEHFTPVEMWNACGQEELPAEKLRIVSIVFPYVKKIRDESMNIIQLPRVTLPAEIYSIGRNYANEFMFYILKKCNSYFQEKGFMAAAGMLSEAFTIIVKGTFYSTWSERHAAFATGLGTFSLHEGFITEVGCNVRLASVITNAPLEITPRKYSDPYSNCLYFTKGTCKACIEKCPANAIIENGHDKTKCYNYGQKIARKMKVRLEPLLKPHPRRVNRKLRPPSYPVGCAFCQFGVPCMDKNPTSNE